MQALILTHSKSKYYNSHEVEEHIPDVDAFECDEMGLVQAIVVKGSVVFLPFFITNNILINKILKERSSSQCKGLFKTIQMHEGINAVQLLLDMKIWWGSTHIMLKHALSCCSVSVTFPIVTSQSSFINNLQCIDTFVYKMGCIAGGESIEKCHKIDSLQLTVGEQ